MERKIHHVQADKCQYYACHQKYLQNFSFNVNSDEVECREQNIR